MAEIDYDKLIEPTENDEEVIEPVAEEPEEVKAEEAEDKPEEKAESRENARVRQLVEEKNELKGRVEALEKLQEEIVKLRESMKEPEKPPEPEVEFMDDPKEYVDQNRRALEERLAHLEKQDLEANDLNKQEVSALRLQMSISESEREFTSEHPDYLKALEHNRTSRLEELELMGVDGEQARQVVAQEEIFLARRKLETGESPAEAAYNLALKRGYKPQAVNPETVDEELDEEVAKRERAANAQSMGGSGVSGDKEPEQDDQAAAWDPIIQAAKEAYGEKAARELFGDLMND